MNEGPEKPLVELRKSMKVIAYHLKGEHSEERFWELAGLLSYESAI